MLTQNAPEVDFMKAFISLDLEGLPYIVIPGHLSLKGTLYSEARKIATKIVLIVAEAFKRNGFSDILIADSHGPMVNIEVDDLPEYVELVRGYPRPTSMVAGVEENCDVAAFLGYHAKFGTARSTFDHTYSGRSVNELAINGVPVSEFLLNAYTAGYYNVPVVMVGGDEQLLKDDVTRFTPWAETVTFKHSLSRTSAKSSSMIRLETELRGAVKEAVNKFNEGETKPLIIQTPVSSRLTFLASHFADVADLLPITTRIDGLTVEYTADTIVDAYKIFQHLTLAASGIAGIYEQMM
ncbi:MAG: M55 family metallopeptidase [Candidatus Heimdallarchaeota archaeon]